MLNVWRGIKRGCLLECALHCKKAALGRHQAGGLYPRCLTHKASRDGTISWLAALRAAVMMNENRSFWDTDLPSADVGLLLCAINPGA